MSITCYFYFHRCCNLWWVRRGFFWIINLSVMCQYRYQKHAFYRSAINYVLRSSKRNNIFWTIIICYSYIFHDLKRCPYALEIKKTDNKVGHEHDLKWQKWVSMSQSFIPRFDFHYSEVGLYTKTTSLRTVIPFVLKNSYLLGYPTTKFIIWFRVRWRSKMQPLPVRKYGKTHALVVTYVYWSTDWR